MLGMCALHIDYNTLRIVGSEIRTMNMNKPSGGRRVNDWMAETHSDRAVRIREMAWMLGGVFLEIRPVAVACEAPFFNPSRPNAYQVLVEVMKTIENTLYHWNPQRPLYRIETSVAKAAVSPTATDLKFQMKLLKDSKDKVAFAVKHHPELAPWVNFDLDDEHGIDAAVVAYAQLLRFRNGDFSITF